MRGLLLAALVLLSPGAVRAGDGVDVLVAADRAFAAMAKEQGTMNAFKAYAAEDAVSFGAAWEPAIGPAAIAAATGNEGTLSWVPIDGKIAKGGDIGYTWGRFKFEAPQKDGKSSPPVLGKYVTIWQKQPDGGWKFVLDTGAPNGPPPIGTKPVP